ncbi:MAG: hypothetical protein HQM06_12190 [Magnetococcales bacterium]|nr:hypothetical protein [Magnetococcales bacterium]
MSRLGQRNGGVRWGVVGVLAWLGMSSAYVQAMPESAPVEAIHTAIESTADQQTELTASHETASGQPGRESAAVEQKMPETSADEVVDTVPVAEQPPLNNANSSVLMTAGDGAAPSSMLPAESVAASPAITEQPISTEASALPAAASNPSAAEVAVPAATAVLPQQVAASEPTIPSQPLSESLPAATPAVAAEAAPPGEQTVAEGVPSLAESANSPDLLAAPPEGKVAAVVPTTEEAAVSGPPSGTEIFQESSESSGQTAGEASKPTVSSFCVIKKSNSPPAARPNPAQQAQRRQNQRFYWYNCAGCHGPLPVDRVEDLLRRNAQRMASMGAYYPGYYPPPWFWQGPWSNPARQGGNEKGRSSQR